MGVRKRFFENAFVLRGDEMTLWNERINSQSLRPTKCVKSPKVKGIMCFVYMDDYMAMAGVSQYVGLCMFICVFTVSDGLFRSQSIVLRTRLGTYFCNYDS